jgi:carbamoyltransferase
MNLFAFFVGGHDSSVCALRDGELRYRKFERLSGIKHEQASLERVFETCREWRIDPEYVAFSDVGNDNGLGLPMCSPTELFREVPALEGLGRPRKTFRIDHHFAHALSGQNGSDRSRAFLAVAFDSKGDHDYRARCFRVGENLDAEVVYESKACRTGDFFYTVGALMGLKGSHLGLDHAGKLMGLQAYGRPDSDFVDSLAAFPFDELPERLLTEIPFRGQVPGQSAEFFRVNDNENFLDWLASCHELLATATLRLFETLKPTDEPVEFSGGIAQNSVFNEMLSRRFPGFTVMAHPYDGGITFGCLNFLVRLLGLPSPTIPSYPFLQDDEDVGYADEGVQERVAELVAEGKVVGWMQGRGEVGPRALGHRSILYDARDRSAKNVLNSRVKFREPWRPFAASVALDDAPDWFEIGAPSPWMQRALVVRPERRAAIPGVVHVDGTCRAQTIDASNGTGHESFLGVIRRFGASTGVPLVLNTSLNSGGEPIYGFRKQAEALLGAGRLDALCVGNELFLG